MMLALLMAAAAPAAAVPIDGIAEVARSESCKSEDASEILVCGRSSERFRIDPSVLAATRAREALPPKPPANAEMAQSVGCVGPTACKGDQVPLVGMALVALKSAELAAKGEDWREPLRTHEDEYRLYKQAEERRARQRKVRIGFGVR